ncbi:hypothetical protein [Thiocystis violascens]|uniref:hypothetical protein n=1 Tax=Thiocystis violascens TaxID=73141 RepID=UPI0012F623BA|nr:hypothetical protein [Thiocystis violascens]
MNDNTWYGSTVPFSRQQQQVHALVKARAGTSSLTGMIYHLRIGWKERGDREEDGWTRYGAEEIETVEQELARTDEDCVEIFSWFENCTVYDDRHESPFKIERTANDADWLMLLPKRHLMKWDILKRLEKLSDERGGESCTLVIADIQSYEAGTYHAAISDSGFGVKERWPAAFQRIVLATNRLTFAFVDYETKGIGRHGFSATKHPGAFKSGLPPFRSLPDLSVRSLVIHWIKWLDSIRLWRTIDEWPGLFIAERITWCENSAGGPSEIGGYLNFPKTAHNNLCMSLYRNALSRIFGLYDESSHELIPLDRLALPVVQEVYEKDVLDPPNAGVEIAEIAVGSVLVSGATLHASGLAQRSVHLLVHPDSQLRGKKTALFHWFAPCPADLPVSTKKRVGRTAAIAPEGWLSFEVPRYQSTPDEPTADPKPIGARTPGDTYSDLQSTSPVIAKFGHWCYEGHHDFLTFNIDDAVRDAFLRKGPLARFLCTNVLAHLGVPASSVREEYLKLIDSTEMAPAGIIVYRSHPSSDRIIRRVLDVLDGNGRKLAETWIFPVQPLRTRWGSNRHPWRGCAVITAAAHALGKLLALGASVGTRSHPPSDQTEV